MTAVARPAAAASGAIGRIVWPLSGLMDRAGAIVHRYRRPIRDALVLVGLIRAGYYFFVQDIQPWRFWGIDARAYWGIDLAHPYTGNLGVHSAFLYSPAFAQLMAPFSLLPYEAYLVLWTALLAGIALWLARPWPPILLILALPVIYEVLVGNVHLVIAACVVVGFRLPWVYVYPVWAKLTPAVGLGWWFVRGEWRPFLVAVGAILGVGAVSVLLQPTAWVEWIEFLRVNTAANDFLLPRALLAVVLTAFGAMTGRRWLVAVAVWFALPVIYINSWTVLLAVVRLTDRQPAASWLPRPGDPGLEVPAAR